MGVHATCRRGWSRIAVVGVVMSATACAGDGASAPDAVAIETRADAKPGAGAVDPRANFYFAPGLAVTGESATYLATEPGLVGTYAYRDGECGVNSKIFATLEKSNSGDAIMDTRNPRTREPKCLRKLVFDLSRPVTGVAPVPASVASEVFTFVPKVQNTVTKLPIGGDWVPQNVNFGYLVGPCTSLTFNGSSGSDRAEIRRTAADRWEVRTAAGAAKAWCGDRQQLFELPFQFTIVSSYPLP